MILDELKGSGGKVLIPPLPHDDEAKGQKVLSAAKA
jgi:hypothetical protein